MNNLPINNRIRRVIAWLVIVSMTMTQASQVAALTLTNQPLAAVTTATVRPNLMFVLDDSGSMAWDYSPDYINDATTAADPGSVGGNAGDGALATVSVGHVTAINPDGSPAAYSHTYLSAPTAVILGGGGTGAAATVNWNASTKKITSITVASGGSGYTSAPFVGIVGAPVGASWGMCWGTSSSNAGGVPLDTVKAPTCTTGTQIPYATAAVNYMRYDPAVQYEAPFMANGSHYANASTTTASNDGYLGGGTLNLTTSWPHEVWCNTASPSPAPTAANIATHAQCKENADTTNNTLYPNAIYTYRKTYNGPASYYTMMPSEYCSDDAMINCVRSTTPVVSGGTVFNIPALYRWCSYYNPLTHAFGSCQGKRDWSHFVPNYLGGWVSTGAAGVQATAPLVINSVATGQKLLGLTIGGVDVVGGQTFTAIASDTPTTIAASICTAVQANINTTGYGCASLGNGTALLTKAITGVDTSEVIALSPIDDGANSHGTITVVSAPAGYSITTLKITGRSDGTEAPLIGAAVSAGTSIGDTSQAICEAINAGPSAGLYKAKSGDPADTTLALGTCQSTSNGWVYFERTVRDTVDNGATIAIAGPVASSSNQGSFTVNSTGGATRIVDIKLGATSILGSNATIDNPDGTLTNTIAADLVSKISVAGCTASATGNTVTLTGTCSGTLTATAYTASGASGVIHITGSTNAATFAGITVAGTQILGTVPATAITANSTALANATAISNQINASTSAASGGAGPTHFSAAAPVASSGGYDITISAPAPGDTLYSSAYSNSSFTFLPGTHTNASSGAAPRWVFPITGASADSATWASMTCGTDTIALPNRSTGTSGSNVDWVRNLANGFNGQTVTLTGGSYPGNYSYTCNAGTSPAYNCTITGPTNSPACTMATTPTSGISAGPITNTNPGASPPSWTFGISDATTDSRNLPTLSCGGTQVYTGSASTLAGAAANHILNLSNGLVAAGTSGYSFAKISGASSGQQRIQVTGPTGATGGYTFCNSNLGITYDTASITLAAATPSSGTLASLVASPAGAAYAAGSQPTYTFAINDASTASRTISSIQCPSGTTITSGSASTGSAQTSNLYATTLATDITNQQQTNGASNDWSQGNGTCTATSSTNINCQLALSSYSGSGASRAPRCTAFTVTPSGGPALAAPSTTHSTATGTKFLSNKVVESDDGSRFWYSFDISGISGANQTASVSCTTSNGSQTAATNASTGSTTQWNNIGAYYVNNLQTNLKTRVSGSWGLTCSTPSDAATHPSNCVLTGPVSSSPPASCAIAKDVTINVAGNTGTSVSINKDSGTGVASNAGTSAQWTFDIQSSTTDNRTIGPITCGGTNTLSTTANSGTGTAQTDAQRVNNLGTWLTGHPATNWTITQNTLAAGSGSPPATAASFTVTGPQSSNGCSWAWGTAEPSITTTGPGSQTGGTGTPQWTFPISNATADNLNFGALTCGGTSIIPSPTPNTGSATSSATYRRINNLTGASATYAADGTTLQSSAPGSLTASGYTMACDPATLSSLQPSCTLTGPIGLGKCNASTLAYTKAASITTGAVTFTDGSAATARIDDFVNEVHGITQVSGFGSSRAQQGLSLPVTMATVNQGTISTATAGMSSGVIASGAIPTNATGQAPNRLNMSGGQNPDATTNHWADLGIFKRFDIVSGGTYPRASGRTDCASATCTYAEELQNFANWYTYYRIRHTMLKSAATIAFNTLDSKYRVGYDNICNATGTTVITPVAQFVDSGGEVSNQRSTWWNKLTTESPSCATPLRAETAKIGKYFAHKLGSVTDPMQYSCQQNFMMLVTDGYWNENEPSATSLTGGDIGNVDNTAARPYYDGAQPSTTCPSTGSARNANNSSCRTLADITWYYYTTDLRTTALGNATGVGGASNDVATNNVLTNADDKQSQQHMSFYAMGLGIDGTLQYQSDYQTAAVGDYAQIVAGSKNWPAPANLDPTAVDDLWHATVNGHGKYFSARNLPGAIAGLREALNKIGMRVGSAAAAATSNLEPVAGDNFAYVASYATLDWTGDLQSRTINTTTGSVSTSTACSDPTVTDGCTWSAQAKLDNLTWSARRIYVKPTSGSSGDPVRLFAYNNLSGSEQALFAPNSLSQYPPLSVSNPSDITASNLVDFLRGDRGLEQDGNTSHPQIWRTRAHLLGDIVDTQPVFSKAPNKTYTDAGYSDFKTTGAAATRRPVVYVSAQDGMIHAFNADTSPVTIGGSAVAPGEELWAFIPTEAMGSLKVLADPNFTTNHRYFVDGAITIADVNFGASDNDWHTILVAGLGGGGKSYVALDVTNPLAPKYLWEFSHANLGYTFSNPVAVKLPTSNQWVVMFASGYNNIGNGHGLLFAIDPRTGQLVSGFPLDNSSGTAAAPSNLGKISVWADNGAIDNTAQYAYAGDLNGDLWRFDFNPSAAGHSGAQIFQLAHLSSGGTPQPISTKVELSTTSTGQHVVYVGTGEYLSTSDLTSTSTQSMYAIKDTLGVANLGGSAQQTWDPQTDMAGSVPLFKPRKLIGIKEDGLAVTVTDQSGATVPGRMICGGLASTVTVAGVCNNQQYGAVDWNADGGWYVDLPATHERINVEPKIIQGTLTFSSNIPEATSCTVGGFSYLNQLNASTGLAVTVPDCSNMVLGPDGHTMVCSTQSLPASVENTDSLVVGITLIKVGDSLKAIQTLANYRTDTEKVTPQSTMGFEGKNSLWREFEVYK